MTARIPYRPEVDGLRAVAIILVVLYHLDIPAFSGGFVGVDCFFVISGFLIFSLLYREQATTGVIDWKAFYARRITRLLPEATVVIVAVVIVGYFVLLPTGPTEGDALSVRRIQLAQAGAAGSLWVANLHFWQYGSGYFAPWSGREPLIHLWSLGVEEQFYLAVPVMFWLATVLSRSSGTRWNAWAWALLVSTFLPSVALAVAYAGKWSAFYLLPTRAYEFAIGAALALWMARHGQSPVRPAVAGAVALGGVVGLIASVSWLESDRFPGAWALLPTIGTAALVFGSATPGVIRQALVLRPVVYIGRVSYGWYLWHWPLLVLWREYRLYDVTLASEAAVATFALLPAAIGQHWVAKLRRNRAPGETSRVFRLGATGAALSLLVCALAAWAAAAGSATASDDVRLLNARLRDGWMRGGECLKERFDASVGIPECEFGDPQGAFTVVLWGDSHAAQWLPGLDPLLKERGIRGIQRILFGCFPSFMQEHPPSAALDGCSLFNKRVIDELSERVRAGEHLSVVFSARWAAYLNPAPLSLMDRRAMPDRMPDRELVEASLSGVVSRLKALGVPVGLTQAVPELRYNAPLCLFRRSASQCDVPWDVQRAYLRPAIEMIASLAESRGLPVLDPLPVLCREGLCRASADGVVLYWDDDHLSESALGYLRGPMSSFVDALLDQRQERWPTAAPPERH